MPLDVIMKPPWFILGRLLSEFWIFDDVPVACGAIGNVHNDDCCWLSVVDWVTRFNLFWNKILLDDELGVLAWNMLFELFAKSTLTMLLLFVEL